MKKLKIHKKDTVLVMSGKDKGKKGEVLAVYADKNRVLVSKVNVVTKATKPTQNQPGGLDKKEAPIHISNVALVCPKCEQANRPKRDKLKTGEQARVCRKCGEVIL